MLDFLKSLFKPAAPSGETAKERLRLVLLSDHLSLAPDVVESLKRDLMEVISRYVEIDSAHADVTFEHRDREIAMLASIPITGVRERKAPQATVFPPVTPASESVSMRTPDSVAERAAVDLAPAENGDSKPALETRPGSPARIETAHQRDGELGLGITPEPKPKPKPKATPPGTQAPLGASNAAAPRRRRRKKYAAAAAAAAAKRSTQQQPLGNQASAQG